MSGGWAAATMTVLIKTLTWTLRHQGESHVTWRAGMGEAAKDETPPSGSKSRCWGGGSGSELQESEPCGTCTQTSSLGPTPPTHLV